MPNPIRMGYVNLDQPNRVEFSLPQLYPHLSSMENLEDSVDPIALCAIPRNHPYQLG